MKSAGIVRKVDQLGRIVIPIELRRIFNIAKRDSIEILVEGDQIVLQKYQPTCTFCGGRKDIVILKGKNICKNCLKDIINK